MINTTEWECSPEHPGYQVKIVERGIYTVKILRPELTHQEREKRMEEIKQAAIRLVLETEKVKRRKENHHEQHDRY